MSNKPKPLPHADLIHKWADGFTIQAKTRKGEWEDIDVPVWNEKCEYRIKPSNAPWSPKKDEEYFYLDVFNGEFCAVNTTWNSTFTDYALRRNNNIFPTKEEAESAIPRVVDAFRGTTNVSANVGSDVGSPTLDGKPLTEGEKALIQSMRDVEITSVPDFGTTTLCYPTSDGTRCQVTDMAVAFFVSILSLGDKERAVIAALKQIKEEQKEKQ